MVAFNSTPRPQQDLACKQPSLQPLAAYGGRDAVKQEFAAQASRRNVAGVNLSRAPDGAIAQVRIGRWRTLAAGVQRRIVEVRELACDRIAVKINRFADGGEHPSSEIWQLYDREGRLEAALQSSIDGKFAVLTNYQTREASRLVRDQRNELVTVETWRI
jgi:hypothetical protein